jgi:hypothetical protein
MANQESVFFEPVKIEELPKDLPSVNTNIFKKTANNKVERARDKK